MQSTPTTLEEILARHEWISTFTHPPDVAFLLRTNDAPSPLQSAGLKTSLESAKTALAELQSDLDLLHNATAVLQSQMSRLQSFEDGYKAALSPIRRIPPEITMEILRRSWEHDNLGSCFPGRHVSGFNVFTVQEGPWHLGQVCRLWRNIIETLCPELWAAVAVDIPLRFMRRASLKTDALVEMLRVVLERSRNYPLDFYLELCDAEAGALQTKVMERCFHMLVAHSKRWRAIEIVIPPALLPQLSLIRGKTDCLRDIYIYCSRADPQSGDIHAFEIAPKLEKLYFKGLPPEANIHFPVDNLVSFSDERPFAGDRWTPKCLDIIKSAPKLRSFSYNDYGIDPISAPFSIPDVMSRSVEELSASSPSFMRSLVLPSLKGFTLTTGYHILQMGHELIKCPVDALSSLHEMLVQSQCFLTRLHLIDVVLNDDLANIIRLVPGLQDFVIKFHEWEDEYDPIMVSLVTQLSETNLVDGSLQHTTVPSLQELGIYLYSLHYTHVSFIDSTFVDMVASRVRRPPDARRLARLDLLVRGSGWSYEINEVALNRLRGEGLELHFSRNDEDPGIDSDE
ncbi:hypothetical protein ARMSODRAFT_954817 [Armillaria solidipes]|uniref:F-box domain-containing protein n=1 Tax=Armillaria solidipes TaxID=1076256 RepID=A0A2H3BMB2_9AGAR|nr:hypothetical protein ARMSODRAFT_954817 [Armillaria solidipes]